MKTGKNKYIIDVVPLTRIPLTRNQSFSYLSDEKLEMGTLVNIPLFRRNIEGIVLSSRSDFHRLGNIKLKKINKIIENNFLTKKQLELAKYLSKYYISPLGTIVKNFVPKRTKKSIKYHVSSVRYKKRNLTLTEDQAIAVKNICKNHTSCIIQNTRYLLFGPSGSGKTEVYIHSIMKLAAQNAKLQFLVLVPEQTLTPQAIERYGAYFGPGEVVLLTSNLSRGQYWANWLKIRSGEAKVVIGTRMAIFAPFQNLGLVVIDEEQDMSFKQWDMNPRYDAREAAEKIAELHKCPIVRGSATPSIETFYRTEINDLVMIKLPHFINISSIKYHLSGMKDKKIHNTSYIIPDTFLVDMKKERWQKNYSCISKKLRGEIAYILKNKLQAILLVNRQGMSSFSICESCKNVLRCPSCDRALVYDERGNHRCIHCSYKTSITPQCPKCKGLVFKNVGLGTQKVEREINSLFPDAQVARIDTQSVSKDRKYHQKIYEKFADGEIDILVGSQMITKGWDFPNVALVGIIDADNMLTIPDFRTAEKAFDLIVQLSGRTARPRSKWPGTVIIQLYNPENKIIKMAAEKNYERFYQEEIAERKVLGLPPYKKIIKLTFQDYNFKKVESSAIGVYNMLKDISGEIDILMPQEAFISRIRGRYRRQIILKAAGRVPEELIKIIKSLSAQWIVDVDPTSLI